jgi:hypothetical protein
VPAPGRPEPAPSRRGRAAAAAVSSPAAAPRRRPARRSRGRLSGRLWLIAAAVVILVIVVAGVAFTMRPTSTGPAHVLTTPPRLGAFAQDPKLAAGMDAAALRTSIVARSGGEAKHVVDAVYEQTTGAGAALGPQIVLFIGGNLSGTTPQSFISSFTGKLTGAVATSPGSLGGDAACVPSIGGRPAECAWADNDTFGVLASPTLGAASLASELRTMRPLVEHKAS